MKKVTLFLFSIFFLTSSASFAQNVQDVKKPQLSQKIDYHTQKHQDLRNRKNDILRRHGWNSKQMKENEELINEALATNYKVAKKILNEHGLPTISMVGEKSAHNFWEMVIHFDNDPVLQRQVISMMDKALETNDVFKKDFAYLSDRWMINSGRKQYYGTQLFYDEKNKSYKPHPIHDEEKVNTHRAEMDLPPMENYIASMNANFDGTIQKPNPRRGKHEKDGKNRPYGPQPPRG